MARIAILALEHAGHQIPTGSLGLAMQRRGHDVTVVALPSARTFAEQLGLSFVPLAPETSAVPRRMGLKERLRGLLRYQALGPVQLRLVEHAELTFRHAPGVLRELGAEAMIVDQNPLSGATIAEHLDLPYVTVFSALMGHEEPDVPPLFKSWPYELGWRARWRNRIGNLGMSLYNRALVRHINRQRAAWGLPPRRGKCGHYSPYAQISPMLSELDFPRRQLPDVCHYVGSLGASRPESDQDFPWNRLDGRRLVFASVGTVKSPKNAEILRLIVAACRGVDVQLVLALGKWRDKFGNERDVLGEIESSSIVVDYAPQLALLRRAALLITHAGQNTVMEAVAAGVPMVALPRNADQPGVAARVAHAGVGLMHSPKQLDAAALRGKIERVLHDESFRRRAAELREASVRAGGAARAAEIFERVIVARRPVTRQELA